MSEEMKIRSTTVIAVKRDGKVAMAGDGQVTAGNTVVKGNARKVRRIYEGRVLTGFAGSVADAFTLFDKFEETLSLRATTQYLLETYPQRPLSYECLKKHLKNTLYYGVYRGVEEYCEPYITKERHDKIYELII